MVKRFPWMDPKEVDREPARRVEEKGKGKGKEGGLKCFYLFLFFLGDASGGSKVGCPEEGKELESRSTKGG